MGNDIETKHHNASTSSSGNDADNTATPGKATRVQQAQRGTGMPTIDNAHCETAKGKADPDCYLSKDDRTRLYGLVAMLAVRLLFRKRDALLNALMRVMLQPRSKSWWNAFTEILFRVTTGWIIAKLTKIATANLMRAPTGDTTEAVAASAKKIEDSVRNTVTTGSVGLRTGLKNIAEAGGASKGFDVAFLQMELQSSFDPLLAMLTNSTWLASLDDGQLLELAAALEGPDTTTAAFEANYNGLIDGLHDQQINMIGKKKAPTEISQPDAMTSKMSEGSNVEAINFTRDDGSSRLAIVRVPDASPPLLMEWPDEVYRPMIEALQLERNGKPVLNQRAKNTGMPAVDEWGHGSIVPTMGNAATAGAIGGAA